LQVLVANINTKLLQNVKEKVYSKACITNFANLPSDCSDKDGSDSETEALVNAGVASVTAQELSHQSRATMKLIPEANQHILWRKEGQ